MVQEIFYENRKVMHVRHYFLFTLKSLAAFNVTHAVNRIKSIQSMRARTLRSCLSVPKLFVRKLLKVSKRFKQSVLRVGVLELSST